MQKYFIILLFFSALFTSCMDEPDELPNSYQGNFDALWKIIDTKYCYLEYKNINWDSVYVVYKERVPTIKNDLDFFDLMAAMLAELKDGHVNLYTPFDQSRYWKWYTDYPSNYSSELIYSARYLGSNYRIAGGMRYGTIDSGKIGYIYCGSFAYGFTDTTIEYILNSFSHCDGLIVDVRNNGGGSLSYSEKLASYFFTAETVTGYIRHKVGEGHADFSKPTDIKTPSHKTIRWQRPVVVLTNRMSYSATNDFINRMKQAPQAIVVGDMSGGGGGLPLSSEIPNGWMVRFSAAPMFDAQMQHTEWGIEPDVKDSISATDFSNKVDGIIERAILEIKR